MYIIDASFGRQDNITCKDLSKDNAICETSGVKEIVARTCYSQNKCELEAKTSIFGDECPGVSKYLTVKYACRGNILRRKSISNHQILSSFHKEHDT